MPWVDTAPKDDRDLLIISALLVIAAIVGGLIIAHQWWYWRVPNQRIIPVMSPTGRVYDCMYVDTHVQQCWPLTNDAPPTMTPVTEPVPEIPYY